MFKQFRFKNFKPSSDLAIRANLALFETVDRVPNGNLAEAIMTKVHDKYLCHLEIDSQGAPFVVECSSTNPYMALKRVKEKIKDKVELWQTKKFIMPLMSLVHTREYKIQGA
jgi:hypothetical protein